MAHGEEVQIRDCAERIADQFGLSSEARLEMTASGSKARYVDRTHWAATYLRQAVAFYHRGDTGHHRGHKHMRIAGAQNVDKGAIARLVSIVDTAVQ